LSTTSAPSIERSLPSSETVANVYSPAAGTVIVPVYWTPKSSVSGVTERSSTGVVPEATGVNRSKSGSPLNEP
jgi:hypothetical protein